MGPQDRLGMCNKHGFPLFYRGFDCPWCEFVEDIDKKMVAEYRRGFEDGAAAVIKDMNTSVKGAEKAEVPNE
jgi:hypothetical protein